MQQVSFKPKPDVQDYLNNTLNHKIYNALTESTSWKNLFEPLAFFNLLYERFDWILRNLSKPLDIRKGLSALDLEPKPYYFLLDCLLKLVYSEADPTISSIYVNSELFIESYESLSASARISAHEQLRRLGVNNFEKRKESLLLIFTIIEKEQYRVKKESKMILPIAFDPQFEEETEPSVLKLNNKKSGSKVDVIRIFNAMFDLHLIESADGSMLTKENFMIQLGSFLGEDFRKYAGILSQSMNGNPDVHLNIFEQLKKKAEFQLQENLKKGNKKATQSTGKQ